MIKKIKVERLKPGVFIHDFNSGWLHHPFLRNRQKVKTDRQIDKIVKYGIREVYIDTDCGLDVDEAPTQQEVDREIEAALAKIPDTNVRGRSRVPLEEEITRAKRLISEAKITIQRLADDVKLGKQIDMGQVESLVAQMTESVLNNQDALISLARIKNKDEYTYLHCLAVSALCISFAGHLGFDYKQTRKIGVGGLLHDIGKVKVPIEILNKPGPLSEKEFEIMKEHVKLGDEILKQTTDIDADSACVTAHHHERLDGTGYPEGLKGDRISFFGQVAAIVDIYDALTSERCYKDAIPPTEALRKIYEWSDGYLNRQLVEQFIAFLGIYPVGTVVRLRSGFIGVVVDHGEKGLLYPTVRAVCDARKQKLVKPFLVDPSRQRGGSDADEIVGCESPESCNILPEKYLSSPD